MIVFDHTGCDMVTILNGPDTQLAITPINFELNTNVPMVATQQLVWETAQLGNGSQKAMPHVTHV